MPSTTRPAKPGPSSQPNGLKRYTNDTEVVSNRVAKKQRVDQTSPGSHSGRDSHRDNNKRRKKKKKKVPVVNQSGPFENNPIPAGPHRQPTSKTSLARNVIIRFSSAAPEVDSSSKRVSKLPTPEMPADAVQEVKDDAGETTDNPVVPSLNKEANDSEFVALPATVALETKVKQLTQELATTNDLLLSHQALLNQVQQAITCQICLEFMHKPYALSPCGHLVCYDCLVQWFKAPPPDDRLTIPVTSRKKTCPHCRAVIRNRPIEIWGFKNIVQSVSKSNLVRNQSAAPSDPPENQNYNADPWANIFPRIPHGGDDVHNPARGEDVGMLDIEDGGIYRCLTCMHEIWNGVCTGCGCEYPGHRHHEDDDDVDLGYLVDDPSAEEVDMDDDPGWMGLEVGDADDVDEADYGTQLFPWHFLADYGLMIGAMPIFDEDEDGEDVEAEGIYEYEEDDGSDDEEYEGSFIDDEDADRPRIYELSDDEDAERPRIYEIFDDADGHDQLLEGHSYPEEEEEDPVPLPSRRIRNRTIVVPSDDDDEQESDFAPRSFGGGRPVAAIYSDGSDVDDDDNYSY